MDESPGVFGGGERGGPVVLDQGSVGSGQTPGGCGHDGVQLGEVATAAAAGGGGLIGFVAGRAGYGHGSILKVEEQVRQRVVLFRQRVPVAVFDSGGALVDEVADFLGVLGAYGFQEQGFAALAEILGGVE